MYLDYFNFNAYPFSLTPNTDFFCILPQYREALNVLLVSIRSGEGFIKIVGDVGTGKTMLCRALLNNLGDEYITAYIPNPALDYMGLHKALAQELEIDVPENIDQYKLLTLLNDKLLKLCAKGKKVVVIIDEAQMLTDQGMEGLRLLSNLETSSTKLLQLLLFGQTELDKRLKQTNLRQLRQRIAFSHRLQSLGKEEIRIYVEHRLIQAGNRDKFLFSKGALTLLTNASNGNPRLINILCHKALMAAFGQGAKRVSKRTMQKAVKDTDSIPFYFRRNIFGFLGGIGLSMLLGAIVFELFLLVRLFI